MNLLPISWMISWSVDTPIACAAADTTSSSNGQVSAERSSEPKQQTMEACLEDDVDWHVLRERVVVHVDAPILGHDVGLGLALVRRTAQTRQSPIRYTRPVELEADLVTDAMMAPFLSCSTMMRFLLSCSWIRMTFSTPLTMK